MAAYLIGHITVKDPVQWGIYTAGVGRSLLPYKAELIFRGTLAAVLAGEHDHMHTVVIKFPDQDTLNDWYQSEAYQSLIPVRDQAADVVILTFDA